MKTIRLYGTLTVLTLLAAQCGQDKGSEQLDCLYVVMDKTDSGQHTNISFADLQPFLRVSSTEPLAGAHVQFSLFTDRKYNPTHTIVLSAIDALQSNELKRKSEISRFARQVDSCLKLCNEANSGYTQSEVFGALSRLIEELAGRPGTKRLVVVSDLHHNNSNFCAYDTAEFNALRNNPEDISRLLPVSVPLNGMNIHLIHTSRSAIDDILFDEISVIMKRYLQSKGAKVSIGSSLHP